MKIFLAASAAALALSSTSTFAQTAVPVATVAPVAIGGPQSVLRTGTQVNFRLLEELTTKGKKLRVGYRFRLEVAEDVLVDGHLVIPAGSPAVGEITEVRNKGMWGKSGHLTGEILFVTVGDRQIRMTGTFDDKGVTGTGAVVGAVLFVPVVGFFTTGTSAVVPVGANIKGFIGEDVPLTFSEAPARQAMEIRASPPVAPAPVPAPAPAPAPIPAVASAAAAVLEPVAVPAPAATPAATPQQ